jgi:hypothetical protein
MSDLEPFPELVERQRLDQGRINGVDPARLTIGAEGDAVVTFRDEVAALQNVLGVYLIDPTARSATPRSCSRASSTPIRCRGGPWSGRAAGRSSPASLWP